jgi:murein DD-endopeptidase MepM/ murein hydrolase activator NlpD
VKTEGLGLRGVIIRTCLLATVCTFVWMGPGGEVAAEEGTPPPVEVSWSPTEPKQGEVLHVRVRVPEGMLVEQGEMLSRPLRFSPSSVQPGEWDALFGIDMGQKPGDYAVKIRLAARDGTGKKEVTSTIRIVAQTFGEERFSIPDDSKVHLSQESLARVKKEKVKISALWPAETQERLWDGPFVAPVEGRPGSPFGMRRWINGERRNSHSGMDIKAPEGRPVKAANSGRVALVGDFFFAGNAVFLDHGQGVYTMYFHLSRIDVAEGQEVAKGEVLGLVGMTGRATGPHLHWGVRLGGARVDPASLMEQTGGNEPEEGI